MNALAVAASPRVERAWDVLAGVPDPEVPALSVCDLGIVREVREEGDALEVVLTPTYSGCPATEVIERSVLDALAAAGLGPARATLRRAPAWTTDWISADGRRKLREYGIAPPACASGAPVAAAAALGANKGAAQPIRWHARAESEPQCPRCGSANVEPISRWGSTPCKALYRCLTCAEPFDYFKPY